MICFVLDCVGNNRAIARHFLHVHTVVSFPISNLTHSQSQIMGVYTQHPIVIFKTHPIDSFTPRPHWQERVFFSGIAIASLLRRAQIATLWQVSVGGSVDANMPISGLDQLPQTHVARRNFKNSVPHRWRALFSSWVFSD